MNIKKEIAKAKIVLEYASLIAPVLDGIEYDKISFELYGTTINISMYIANMFVDVVIYLHIPNGVTCSIFINNECQEQSIVEFPNTVKSIIKSYLTKEASCNTK